MFAPSYFPTSYWPASYWPPGAGVVIAEVEFYGEATLSLQQQYTAGGELSVGASATYFADPSAVPEVDFQTVATLQANASVNRQGECNLPVTCTTEFTCKYEANGAVDFQCGSDLEINTAVQYACGVEYIGVGFYSAVPISANPILTRRNFARYRTQLAKKQEVENFKDVDP
jgi:hypothetical protein